MHRKDKKMQKNKNVIYYSQQYCNIFSHILKIIIMYTVQKFGVGDFF